MNSQERTIIAIAGDSGVGKSEIAEAIKATFGPDETLIIYGDDCHLWDREDDHWNEFTHLNPLANDLLQDYHDLRDLKMGRQIYRSRYDHSTGKFTDPILITPKQFIIYEGLHALYDARVRKLIDIKIYVAASEPLRRYWKINRDTKARGHTKESVIGSCDKRELDYREYIRPQQAFADLVIFYELEKPIDTDIPQEEEVGVRLLLQGPRGFLPCSQEDHQGSIIKTIQSYLSQQVAT